VPAETRAKYLFKACADCAGSGSSSWEHWFVYEVGKSWIEADADVAEDD